MPFLERSDGCRLYYEVHESAGGSPIVLLEGMGGDIPGWRRNIPRLSARHLVVAYDFRGNGRSGAPDRAMPMAVFVDDTLALMDHLDLGSAHLYGQSFGGMVALQCALDHPDRVRSIVLAATHAGAAGRSPSRRWKAPKDRPYLALYAPAFAAAHPDHVEEDVAAGSRARRPLHAGRRQWQAIQEWDVWARLGRIAVPTLVMHGTEDLMVDAENGRRMAAAIPGAELAMLEGAGHVYHSEQPEVADGIMLDFVDRVDGAAG